MVCCLCRATPRMVLARIIESSSENTKSDGARNGSQAPKNQRKGHEASSEMACASKRREIAANGPRRSATESKSNGGTVKMANRNRLSRALAATARMKLNVVKAPGDESSTTPAS